MKYLVVILFLFAKSTCFGQVHYIYLNEIDSFMKSTQYYDFPIYDFKDKMPDGQWIVLGIEKNQINKKSTLKNLVLMSGFFKDSLKHGLFTYNARCLKRNKVIIKERISCYYKNGLLNGYYEEKDCEGNYIESGWYMDGKKHGCFIKYFSNGNLSSIRVYQNDTVLSWTSFSKEGNIIYAGKGCSINKNGIVFIYDNEGKLFRNEIYDDNSLIGFMEYEKTGGLIRESKGTFKECFPINPKEIIPCITQPFPIDGYIKYYNTSNSSVNQIEYYENGVLVKKVFFKNEE